MLKLWGRANSLNVQKVLLCLEELGIPHARVDAGRQFGIVKSAEYMAMNPNSVVPTLEDDGFILWESNVIVRYLAAKHGAGTLWPLDPRARAEADRWMDWQQTTHNTPLTTMFAELVREPGTKSPEEVAQASARLERAMDILEAGLSDRPWLGGNTFTMADCVMAPGFHRYLNLPATRKARPNVERYYAAIMARASARKVLTLPLT